MPIELMKRQITRDEQDAFARRHPGFRLQRDSTPEASPSGRIPAGTPVVTLLDDIGLPAGWPRGTFFSVAAAEEWLEGWLNCGG